ncbi:hypothetical protein C0J52_00733 [Blattella germanica]|nr:hypothetical protein C0J52_00733 [Blattella germanica]
MVRNATAFAYGDSWIHLRWGKPDPPHGVLEYYKVAYGLGDPRTTEIVKVDEYCDLWEGLICGKIEGLKKDREYNIRVIPDRPDNVAAISVSASEMLLNWEHPYITRGRLRSFKVDIMLNSTGLKNYKSYEDTKELFVKKDKKFYSMKVCDLQPASEYKIVIYGVTQSPGETDTVFGRTLLPVPDVGSQLEYDPESITNTTFKILVPAADDFVTKESGFIIIVTSKSAVSEDLEKSRLFKEMKEEKIILATAGVSDWRNSWVAAELKPGERNQFEIGSNGIQDNGCHFIAYGKNRPLVPGGSYEVTLVALYKWNDDYKAKAIKLKDPVKTPLVYVIPEETSVVGWVILALLLICVVPAVAFFVLRRKKLMRKKDDSVELRAHAIATNGEDMRKHFLSNNFFPTRTHYF